MSLFDEEGLHRADAVPDWEKIPEADWTEVQRRAAETKGWDTPGNRESLKGLGYTTLALGMLATGRPWLTAFSVVPMGIGRWKDIKDGKVAVETGTRGPRGEFVDAAIDKILTAGALTVGVAKNFISSTEAIYVGVQQGANIALSAVAERRGRDAHPGRGGKWGMFAIWAGVGSKVISKGAELFGHQPLANVMQEIGHYALYTGVAVGSISTITEYAPAALGSNRPIEQSINPSLQIESLPEQTNPE